MCYTQQETYELILGWKVFYKEKLSCSDGTAVNLNLALLSAGNQS